MKRHLPAAAVTLVACGLILAVPWLPVGTSGWFAASCLCVAGGLGVLGLFLAANR